MNKGTAEQFIKLSKKVVLCQHVSTMLKKKMDGGINKLEQRNGNHWVR